MKYLLGTVAVSKKILFDSNVNLFDRDLMILFTPLPSPIDVEVRVERSMAVVVDVVGVENVDIFRSAEPIEETGAMEIESKFEVDYLTNQQVSCQEFNYTHTHTHTFWYRDTTNFVKTRYDKEEHSQTQ